MNLKIATIPVEHQRLSVFSLLLFYFLQWIEHIVKSCYSVSNPMVWNVLKHLNFHLCSGVAVCTIHFCLKEHSIGNWRTERHQVNQLSSRLVTCCITTDSIQGKMVDMKNYCRFCDLFLKVKVILFDLLPACICVGFCFTLQNLEWIKILTFDQLSLNDQLTETTP